MCEQDAKHVGPGLGPRGGAWPSQHSGTFLMIDCTGTQHAGAFWLGLLWERPPMKSIFFHLLLPIITMSFLCSDT